MLHVFRLLLCAALLVPLLARGVAGGATAVAEVDAEATPPTAPVELDGVVLFRVRGISVHPAEQRARAIAERIAAFARDPALAVDRLRLVEDKEFIAVYAGERLLLYATEADARHEGVARELLARVYRERIAQAVQAYRRERSPAALLTATGYALAATAVLAGLLFGLRRLWRRVAGWLEERYRRRVHGLQIQQLPIVHAERVWGLLRTLPTALAWLVALVLVYTWLEFVLALFPWTRPAAAQLLALVADPLRAIGRGLLAAIPGLVFLAILAVVTRYGLKVVRLIFAGIDAGTVTLAGFEREWAWPTYRLVRLLIVAFAVVVAYPYIPGSDSGAFKGVTLFLGVIFSLGSTSIIANLIAGYSMTYRRAFKIGDRVRINEHVGDVVETGVMVTRLRTPKNEEVVVPNSVILNSSLVNYSTLARERRLVVHTTVGIGYETPWRQVEAMLREAAARTPGLLREPAPWVLQTALGDFCVSYEINACCDDAQALPQLYHALHQNILDVFNEHGVQIMTPAYVADPAQPKLVAREHWYAPPAAPPADTPRR
jgi:small-conductance mechanosensitive channel